MQNDSEFITHGPCPNCGSSDANATYDDGHTYCFSCHALSGGDAVVGRPARSNTDVSLLDVHTFPAWGKRGLTQASCRKWGCGISKVGGKAVRVFEYRDATGKVVAQKTRDNQKDMRFLGGSKRLLYGRHLWGDGGKMLVVTEGEIDAISVSQAQGHKWPVVSIPNGAQGAKKSLTENMDWLSKFDSVILMFDNDEPGRSAAKECASVFRPGQCKIATLELKDPNEYVQAGRTKELINAIWNAKAYRPDGIVAGVDVWETLTTSYNPQGFEYPWPSLQSKTLGIRKGEIVTWTSGSGMGKTEFVRKIAHSLTTKYEQTVGCLFLEENTRRTALGFISHEMGRPLHLVKNPHELKGFRDAYEKTVGNGRTYFYDHFGSTSVANILDRIRYLVVACKADFVILDHLSILVSGITEGDERRIIDNAVTQLRTQVEELGHGLIMVSHLKRTTQGDKGHEEGAQVRLSQLRGSGAIGQLSDVVIGLERDQQSTNTTTLRILKNRPVGVLGEAGSIHFNPDTGELNECEGDEFGGDGDTARPNY